MPLILPDNHPAKAVLESEQIFTMNASRALHQDIRPIHVGIVNLMPNKEETELQLMRMLTNTALQVHIDLIRTESYTPTHANTEHIESFYTTFSEIQGRKYDAMIITGAPVERLDFETVYYWDEICAIFDYAQKNVYSTLFICWAAQAALYYYYGIPKIPVEQKVFGVYGYKVLKETPLTKGFDAWFSVPQSRHSLNRAVDLEAVSDLDVLASREDTGVHLAATKDQRLIFAEGHWEYEMDSLKKEYLRDRQALPVHYFEGDRADGDVHVTWRAHGNLFFSNWMNYCVYQQTPYDIGSISEKRVSKFGGSSLSSAEQFIKVRDIVHQTQDRSLVVVSAPGKRFDDDVKVTDMLIDLVSCRLENRSSLEAEMAVRRRYEAIAEALELLPAFLPTLNRAMEDIRHRGDREFAVSRGEYLSAQLMALYLGFEFCDAADLIFFTPDGTLDKERTYHAIRHRINPYKSYVIPGFYGAGDGGRIRTFSRGGSDISGAIIASALRCKVYENWTDVDGVMSADPRIDEKAQTLEHLSYDELIAMAKNGAQVYHVDAVYPVRDDAIPIHIKNTNHPWIKGTEIGQTVIDNGTSAGAAASNAVADGHAAGVKP